ncbi:hypothetical protein [Streptomyces violascens]|uniref:hypothetical protein n=1 Tax=Streptomyces violascens TaxID=67381 RepID=UPI003690911D
MVTRLFSFVDGATVVGVGLGGATAWQNCDESRRDGGQAADQANVVGQADVDVQQTSRGHDKP